MPLRVAPWLLVLGSACEPASAPPPGPSRGAELDPAVAALLAEREEAVRARPADGRAHGELGLALEANELWREAAESFARAARLEPSEPHWNYHRAITLELAGESGEAFELLRRAAEALGEAPYAQQRLGEAALAQGDFEAARTAFQRTLHLAPDAAEGFTGLGAAELALRRPQAATAALEQAVALDGNYKSAHYQLGLAYRELGRLAEAERELALGLLGRVRFLPDPFTNELRRLAVASTARLQVALALLESGRVERAVRVLENLRSREPGNITILNDLAIALQRSGAPELAQQRLDEALLLDPGVVSTWINLASLALARNTSARALECAERAVALAPESAKAQLMLGRVLLHQGLNEQALAAFARARRADPREFEALALSAQAWLARGEPGEAQTCFAALAAERPYDPSARVGLAEALWLQGELAAAARELEAARALDPHHPEVVALAKKLGLGRE